MSVCSLEQLFLIGPAFLKFSISEIFWEFCFLPLFLRILMYLLLRLVNNSHDWKLRKYEKVYSDGFPPTLVFWLPTSPPLGRDF